MFAQAPQTDLSWGNIAGMIVGGVFVLVITAGVAWGAWTGRDLPYFESLRSRDPKTFRNLVWTQRVSGVICIVMTSILLAMSLSTETGAWGIVLFAPIALIWGWISVRWTVWAWKTRLSPQ